ncbi:GAF domain-containing protein [Coleofasciculus sp. FACHB-712]|uniref:GAF domain-containing sensor histidine kinase n=1 Tax=Coleofasciculus sp. FACHB-712 TaxID=2692789 RepID=UPI0016846B61|nr:ATP-binding protein [Coleofasciculus sp. FACHB-712]MBD1945439.1 GAF domain-containing protein [Coleofasciculus sp. FACHB-712]
MVFLANDLRYSISRSTVLSVAHSLLKFLASQPDSRVVLIAGGKSDFTPSDLCPERQSKGARCGYASPEAGALGLPELLTPPNCFLNLAMGKPSATHCENKCENQHRWLPCSLKLRKLTRTLSSTPETQSKVPSLVILGLGDRFNVMLHSYKTTENSELNANPYELCFGFDPAIVGSICAEISRGLHLTPEISPLFERAIADWFPQPNLPALQSEFTSTLVSAILTSQISTQTPEKADTNACSSAGASLIGNPTTDIQIKTALLREPGIQAHLVQPPIPQAVVPSWQQPEKLLQELLRISWSSQGAQVILQRSAVLIQETFGVSRCLIAFYSAKDERTLWSAIAHDSSIPLSARQTHDPEWANIEQCLLKHHQGNPWATERNIGSTAAESIFLTWLHTHPQKIEPREMASLHGASGLVGLLLLEQWDEKREWQPGERQLLHLALQLVERGHNLATLYQQAEERITHAALLNRLVAQIRASLELSHIFETVTLELGHLLVADRCLIFQYLEEQQCWKPLTEYRAHADILTAMNLIVPDQKNCCSRTLRNLQVVQVSDTRLVDDPMNRSLAAKYPGAWLMVPIHRQQKIWGCLTFAQDQFPRYWHESELRFITTVADQLAIAIYQATLYQQIQAQNQTLEALVRERTAELESFFDAHPDYIFVVERENLRLRFCNHAFAQRMGFDNRYAVQDRSILECFPPLIAKSFAKQNLRVFESGETLHEQETLVFPDGIHHFDTSRVPLKHSNGEVYACLGTFREITELVETKQALSLRTEQLQDALTAANAASQAKTEFLATMSHELRTPLTSVIGMSSALMQPYFGELSGKQKEYLKIIHNSGQHLLQLINDILDLSKIESGKASLTLSQFSLRQVGIESLELLQEKAQVQQVKLTGDFAELPPADEFWGDERRVRQILLNLLSNAVKFTPPGGEVWLRMQCESNQAMIEVADTGIGIPMEKQHLLFEAFQQIDSSLHRQHEGTGLGLALTRQLVEMHGGTISFHSEVDAGTVFVVYLLAQNPK